MAEAEQKPQEPEWKLLGMTYGDWSKVGIGLLSALIGIGLGFWLNRSKPHLTVKVSETAKFQGDKHNPGFASINVTSDGSKEAEGVECKFVLTNVQEVKVSPEALNASVAIKEDKVTVSAPVLNPGETLTIAAYTNNAAGAPNKTDVTVRGKGVVGEPDAPSAYGWVWFIGAIVLAAVVDRISSRSTYKRAFEAGRASLMTQLQAELVDLSSHIQQRKAEARTTSTNDGTGTIALPDKPAP